jgi:hypothetical protein
VNNAKRLMEIQNRLRNLPNDMSGQILTQISKFDQLIEQLSAGTELHYNVAVLMCLDAVDQLGYVGMSQLSHNFDLFFDVSFLCDI